MNREHMIRKLKLQGLAENLLGLVMVLPPFVRGTLAAPGALVFCLVLAFHARALNSKAEDIRFRDD